MPRKTGEGYQDPCCEAQNPETLSAGQTGSLSPRHPRWTKYRRSLLLNASFFYRCKAAERGWEGVAGGMSAGFREFI